MKKKLRILVILIAVLLVGTVGYYFMPKKFEIGRASCRERVFGYV